MKKIINKIILITCFALKIVESGHASNPDRQLRERIYLQTDKELYLAGEQILLKVLTTDQNKIPLVFSKVAYIELVSDNNPNLQAMIELKNGTGTGIIVIPVDFPTGYHRLTAYTQFMRNENDVFFEKNIAVINTFQRYTVQDTVQGTRYTVHGTVNRETVNREPWTLQTDKNTYGKRTQGKLTISGLPENIHTLSVSITGKDFLPCPESDGQMFWNYQTEETKDFSGKFPPEYEGHIITGKITDNQTEKTHHQPTLKTAIGFPGIKIGYFAGNNRENGEVLFFTSGVSDTKEAAAVVYNEDNNYRTDIQSPFISGFAPKPTPELSIDTAYNETLLARSVALQLFRYFSEDISENQNISGSYFTMQPSFSFILDDYTRFTTMREVFTEFIIGARFRRKDGKQEISVLTSTGIGFEYGTTPLVTLDGIPIDDHDAVFNYNPLNIEKINVYTGPFVMGGHIIDGIVELTTYNRKYENLNLNKATQILTYEGPQSQYIFKTPDYSKETNRKSRKPDTRHTLLWHPDIKTNGKNSFTVPFDTSDLTGEFQATVEGITKDGKFIFTTIFFTVE